ncbi:MAG: 5-formyltetrahydrofolate cyclo-ligase [Planctomycetota bacterium]
MPDTNREKQRLRAEVRERLGSLSPEQQSTASDSAAKALRTSTMWTRNTHAVLAYLSLPDELSVDALFDDPRPGPPLPRICAPSIDWAQHRMTPRVILSVETGTRRTRHGVREPRPDAKAVQPSDLGIVLVPGIAFDRCGRRLGRGAGFYDRFLATLPQHTHTVGVCFASQVVGRVPTAAHDVGVRMLLTEEGLQDARPPG